MKNINYINKNFSDFKQNLQNFAKTYFPDIYTNFNEASPEDMFMELSAYVGDILSFRIDTQISETNPLYTQDIENLYSIAYIYGYTPKLSYSSTTNIKIYQLIPNNNGDINSQYLITIPSNTRVYSNYHNIEFITIEDADFNDSTNRTISYFNDSYFLVSKSVNVISASIKSVDVNFEEPIKFSTLEINDQKILGILSITDENNDRWYEVPSLAQQYVETTNSSGSNNILSYLKVDKRFTTRIKTNSSIEIQFGSGIFTSSLDNEIIPNPENINLGLIPSLDIDYTKYNKVNQFFTKNYGLAPIGTLNIKYLTGGGLESNVDAGTLNKIDTNSIIWKNNPSNLTIKNYILQNIYCNNEYKSVGGSDGDSLEDLRLNIINTKNSQNRAVSDNDYTIRTMSLPSIYGNVSKCYVKRDQDILNIYVLSNDENGLIECNSIIKENIKTYLSQYKSSKDEIIIKDAYIINVGINYDIMIGYGYNSSEVILNCNSEIKKLLPTINNINQPLIISKINSSLLKIPGVISVPNVEIINKYGGDYSIYSYDIKSATRKGIIYPSLDPSVFEVKYPDNDIKGTVIWQ